jgi:hypothetical protein
MEILEWKKDISHENGYQCFKKKMQANFPKTYLGYKTTLICFWDSLHYDFIQRPTMLTLDSMASNLNEHIFDFVFATEMDERDAKDFLLRKGVRFKNFKIIGDMDDFISGVYNEKPIIWKDSAKVRLWDPKLLRKKVKPYYLLMDNKGEILYHNYSCWRPTKDTALTRRLASYRATQSLKNLD